MPRHVIESTFPDGLANLFNFKTLTVAAVVLSSVALAMSTQAAPARIDAASNGNLVQVYYRGDCGYGRCYPRYHRYGHYHEHDWPHYGYYRTYDRNYRPDCEYYPVTMIYPGSVSVIDVQGACRKSVPPAGQDGDGR